MFPNVLCYVLLLSTCCAFPSLIRQIWNERDPNGNGREISGTDRLVIGFEQLLPGTGMQNEISDVYFYGYSEGHRQTRALRGPYLISTIVRIGIKLTQSLLKGTTQISSKGKSWKVYKKSGGIEQMRKDFELYNPEQIGTFKTPNGGYGKTGKVGDRILMMKTKGENGKPTLEIFKTLEIQQMKADGIKFSELHRQKIIYSD